RAPGPLPGSRDKWQGPASVLLTHLEQRSARPKESGVTKLSTEDGPDAGCARLTFELRRTVRSAMASLKSPSSRPGLLRAALSAVFLCLLAAPALATDITISANTVPNVYFANLPANRTGTCTVTSGQASVSALSPALPSNWSAFTGFIISLGGVNYY